MGELFWDESSRVLRGRVSVGHFFVRGSVYFYEGCSEVIMYFLLFLLLLPHVYRSYDHLTYIVLIF